MFDEASFFRRDAMNMAFLPEIANAFAEMRAKMPGGFAAASTLSDEAQDDLINKIGFEIVQSKLSLLDITTETPEAIGGPLVERYILAKMGRTGLLIGAVLSYEDYFAKSEATISENNKGKTGPLSTQRAREMCHSFMAAALEVLNEIKQPNVRVSYEQDGRPHDGMNVSADTLRNASRILEVTIPDTYEIFKDGFKLALCKASETNPLPHISLTIDGETRPLFSADNSRRNTRSRPRGQ